MKCAIPRLMIAAPTSGSGKTTITCGILKALLNRRLQPAAFKSGPDYIDPMFHTKVLGAHSRNLDLFLLGESTACYLLAKNVVGRDLAVLEGAMGFYDGLGQTTQASAYALAKATQTPVVLVVNGKGAALSIAATIKGFQEFRPDSNIRGVILNNMNPMSYAYYKDAVEAETGIPLVGYFPELTDCGFESRHLGLITAGEIADLQTIMDKLAAQAEKSLDFEGLLAIAHSAPALTYQEPQLQPLAQVKIAVAQDAAFCFYYQDALDLLSALGATLLPFSPLTDTHLPVCDGLLLGGGYPELYAKELAANSTMLSSIRTALAQHLPCLAECGGFMYLLERYQEGTASWPWVGALAGAVELTSKLKRFGYVTLEAQQDNLLSKAGGKINAHEFHYSESTANGSTFLAVKASGRGQWECINATATLYAGYPHIHLWGNPEFAANFILACQKYAQQK
ncbi:MAG: cobyrinate a,c-diamide synthase [Acidaminococcaceae bacterium]